MCERGGGTGRAKSCLLLAVKDEAEAIVCGRERRLYVFVDGGRWRLEGAGREINK